LENMGLSNNFMILFMTSAPWLILGLAVAGLMKTFVPEQLLVRHLGKPGLNATIKAALMGAPLPLCSCGVIPAALGLRRSGASKAATTSFLISTPETGVDSIAISYVLLGPFMAVMRPVAAIVSAITAGLLVGDDAKPSFGIRENRSDGDISTEQPGSKQSCCSTSQDSIKPDASMLLNRLKANLYFTLVDLVADISPWLLVGLGFAAVTKTYVPDEFLIQWGDGLLAFVVMAVVGLPMYICATASTPIAAGLLFSGVSPGAVLVFMLVGPATNIATVGLVKNELGNRALAAYLGSVIGISFIFGYLTNYSAQRWNIDFLAQAQNAQHVFSGSSAETVGGIILAALMIYAMTSKVFSQLRDRHKRTGS
jgi:uncharacterized protein